MTYSFGNVRIDEDLRELTRDGQLVRTEPQVFDLLIYMLRNCDRVIGRDELVEAIWEGRFISDAAISSRISEARAAVGDSGRQQHTIKTYHGKGFRFIADVEFAGSEGSAPSIALDVEPKLHQDIRYFQSFDGTRIAYSEICSGERVIVKTANWMSHLEYDLESPIWKHWIQALSANVHLVRYDERGNGLSDWRVDQVDFESCVRDLECMIEELGLEKFTLFGVSQGASVAIEYAVRHPEKVDKIIIYGGFAQGWRFLRDEAAIGQRVAMGMLMRTGWGKETSEFRQVFTSRFMPEATREQADWFNELQRKSVAPEMAGTLHDMFGTIDVADRLKDVQAPTLVLHARGDIEIPIGNGRQIASGIPDARFVTLDSQNHILLESEPAFADLVGHVRRFLMS